jgi:hypothetical protein
MNLLVLSMHRDAMCFAFSRKTMMVPKIKDTFGHNHTKNHMLLHPYQFIRPTCGSRKKFDHTFGQQNINNMSQKNYHCL